MGEEMGRVNFTRKCVTYINTIAKYRRVWMCARAGRATMTKTGEESTL